MAQLVINGKRYGPHTFIVNIRDIKTHQAMPGV
jgi:acyl-CoA oxidase